MTVRAGRDRDEAHNGTSAKVYLQTLLTPEQPRLRLAAALSTAASLLWPLQALLVAWTIAAWLTAQGHAVWPYIIGFLLLALLRIALSWLAEGLSFDAAETTIRKTRDQLLERAALDTDLPLSPGAYAALSGEKLELLRPYISRYEPARMRTAIVPLILLLIAFSQSWIVGVIFMITGPLIPVFMILVGIAAQDASRKQMTELASMNDLLVERLSALVDIRLLDALPRVVSSFSESADTLRFRTMAVLRIAFLSSTVLELFSAIGVAMVALYVGFSLLGQIPWASGVGIAASTGIFLLLLAPDFYQPLRDLSAAWHDRASALAVAGELAELESHPGVAVLGANSAPVVNDNMATVETRSLLLQRQDRTISIPDFSSAPGDTIALMGPSGAGKTSTLLALGGILQPAGGSIVVAGATLEDRNAQTWRARLGWMPQSPHFMNGSLRWNIAFGEEARLREAIRISALDDVIARLPRGLDTRMGENGAGLSGGEARRVLLARAICSNPDVVLADEPTADLDETTAAHIAEGLLSLSASGTTVIVATHDDRLAARISRVIRVGEA